MNIVFIIGAIAWFQTALAYKHGPFGLLSWPKRTYKRLVGADGPFTCSFCLGPWIAVGILPVWYFWPGLVQFFGILGLAAAVRGQSQEYS